MPHFSDYKEWESRLHPCDLILFSNNQMIGNLISKLEILHIGSGEWTHVGVICPENIIKIKNKKENQTCILESLVSIGGVNNIETKSWSNGLQIRDLKDTIDITLKTGGKVACYHLNDNSFPLSVIKQRELSNDDLDKYISNLKKKAQFISFWKEYSKSKYDFFNCSRSIGISLPCFSKNTKNNLFCSEAVVRLYQHMNIIDDKIIAENVTPQELANWCGYDIKGCNPFYGEPDILTLPK